MKKIFVIIVVMALCVFAWYKLSLRPADSGSTGRRAVKIESGMSVKEIALRLDELGMIRSPRAFMLYTKLHGVEKDIEAGKFVLRPSMSVGELVEVLQDGKAEEIVVTIPEGFTVKQIDELLAEKGIIDVGEIIRCANECDFSSFEFLPPKGGLAGRGGRIEGYLFPDTYYVNAEEFVPKFFLERLLTSFRHRVIEVSSDEFGRGKRPLHQIITMASLIEEEALTDEERPIVSGILWKRFDGGLGLGVDATVRYILEKPTGIITVSDLNFNSQYNTRKFRGLPPGPIANPGKESIRAALFPEESDYWYYLHGKDGRIHYAKTNEEHNVNKWKYL